MDRILIPASTVARRERRHGRSPGFSGCRPRSKTLSCSQLIYFDGGRFREATAERREHELDLVVAMEMRADSALAIDLRLDMAAWDCAATEKTNHSRR